MWTPLNEGSILGETFVSQEKVVWFKPSTAAVLKQVTFVLEVHVNSCFLFRGAGSSV